MRLKLFGFFLFLVLLLAIPASTFAYNTAVLGNATSSATPTIAPTAEGPGFILPDSKLFFLDRFKQQLRVFLAFTPEAKAKVHTEVAGERLAELRIMLSQNNKRGIETALNGISDNLADAAKEITKARLTGRDVKKLAKDINDNIKNKQEVLDQLERDSQGALRLGVAKVQELVFESKAEVAESLSEDQLLAEIESDIARKVSREAQRTYTSAEELRRNLVNLDKQASAAAQRALSARQAALQKAIAEKDVALKVRTEAEGEIEEVKQSALALLREDALKEANQILQSAQNANSSVVIAGQIINLSSQLGECVGADKRAFKTTREICDAFNKAWGKGGSFTPSGIIGDCTGPDRKTFRTTKDVCDAFNKAWDKKTAPFTPAN